MRLKGEMVIELTDENSGTVETITEENMVTNAVNHLLGMNPMGIFYAGSGQYDEHIQWDQNLIPICPNMIGGILLYSSTLTENANNLYPSSANLPVAYASNDVNATADTARGSMNLVESRALDDGFKFVWEFTPSQGNGTIAAVALTSALGGKVVYGNEINAQYPFLAVKKTRIDDLADSEIAELYSAVEVDFENNCMYSMRFIDSSVVIRQKKLPVFTIGLNDRINDSTCDLIEETVIQCSTFHFLGSYTPYGDFLDGHDGYWYGFANQANSSGDATMYWVKIRKSDMSKTEGVWTLSNAHLKAIGSFKVDSYVQRSSRGVIRNGYLYLMNYDDDGVYKINLSNTTDITLISLGFESDGRNVSGSSTSQNFMVLVNDLIIGYDYMITINDTVIQTIGAIKFENLGTPIFQYKEYLTGWGGNYGSDYHNTWLLMPYLATINNLASAIVKNTDKTMKITYTLTEQDENS